MELSDREKRLIMAAFESGEGNSFSWWDVADNVELSVDEADDLGMILVDKGVFCDPTYGGRAGFTPRGRELARELIRTVGIRAEYWTVEQKTFLDAAYQIAGRDGLPFNHAGMVIVQKLKPKFDAIREELIRRRVLRKSGIKDECTSFTDDGRQFADLFCGQKPVAINVRGEWRHKDFDPGNPVHQSAVVHYDPLPTVKPEPPPVMVGDGTAVVVGHNNTGPIHIHNAPHNTAAPPGHPPAAPKAKERLWRITDHGLISALLAAAILGAVGWAVAHFGGSDAKPNSNTQGAQATSQPTTKP